MIFISLSGLFIFFEQPSCSNSLKDKLSQEEKIERAYNLEKALVF